MSDDWDRDEMQCTLEQTRRNLEKLADQLCDAVEADDWVRVGQIYVSLRGTSMLVKHLRRRLVLEVA